MAEYIRREDAIKCIEGQCVDGKMWGDDESEGTLIEAYSAIDDLMEIPPADVAPVRNGRWLDGKCTVCGWEEPDVCTYDGYETESWVETPY
jgi:hypothetical protein